MQASCVESYVKKVIDLGGVVSLLLGFGRDNMYSSNYTKTWVQFLKHVQYLSVHRPLHYT